MLKISILIPSFNQADYISETIESVLNVLGPKDELIVADAGSTDNTSQKVERYLDDPRIIWNSESDKGFSDGISKIFHRISGDIVGIMSSDDLYLNCDLDRIRGYFDDPGVNLIFADYEIIDASGLKIGRRALSKAKTLEDIFSLKVIIPQSSTFFRRGALQCQLPLSLDYDYVADIAVFNRICHTDRWLQYSEVWSAVRRHPGSRTGKKNPGIQYMQFLEREFPMLASKPVIRSGALLLSARYFAESGRRREAMVSLFKSLLCSPFGTLNHWLLYRTVLQFLPSSLQRSLRAFTGSR